MSDEMLPDEVGGLWRNQPGDRSGGFSPEELRRRAGRFETRVRRGFRLAVVLLSFLTAGYASFLYLFPSPIHRIGASLTLAGFVYGACQLYRRGPARKVPDGPASATCAAYRAELERQRQFHLNATARILAFLPGPVVFVATFFAAEHGLRVAIAVALALAAAPLAAGIPLNRRMANKLEREIRALDSLMNPH